MYMMTLYKSLNANWRALLFVFKTISENEKCQTRYVAKILVKKLEY